MYEEYKEYLGQARPCLICGDDHDATERNLWAKEEYFKAVKCDKCGLVTVDPGLTPEGLNVYYSNNIQRRFDDENKMKDRQIQYKQDREFLEKFISEGKVLDVGCNGGFFLSELSDKFEKFGMEIDKEAVKYANENFPSFGIRCERIGEDSFEKESFDLIVFRGVIEHIYDPKFALKRATELLKPGGKLFFCATPNLESFCADFYREKWNLWHPIQHINIFSVNTLHQLMGKGSYNIVATEYPYLDTPYENQVQNYKKIQDDILFKNKNKWEIVENSPPFWGNMMTVIFQKK
jgi:SAM-dependent methyltransferase